MMSTTLSTVLVESASPKKRAPSAAVHTGTRLYTIAAVVVGPRRRTLELYRRYPTPDAATPMYARDQRLPVDAAAS
jgi:hypothetical protein